MSYKATIFHREATRKKRKKDFNGKCRHLANLKRFQEEREIPKSNVLFRNSKNEDFKEI